MVRSRRGAIRQVDLAAQLGLSQRALSRVEQGAVPQAATAQKLARWLGMSTSAVLDAATRSLEVDLGDGPLVHEQRPMLGARAGPDLDEALTALSPDVVSALRRAHEALAALGVRHLVVGGIAVGAHGFLRATRDVDFLVGDEAFERPFGDFVVMKAGLPIAIQRVAIDYLSPLDGAEMEAVLDAAPADVLRVVPVEMLVLMKLIAFRPKDRLDVQGLVQAGLDVTQVRAYLTRVAPTQVQAFDRLVAEASEG